MPCQRAKRVDGESRCRKPRTVCTRGRDFLASAGLHWGILPKTASRVYTRDAISDKGKVLASSQQGRRADGARPCQEPRLVCTRGTRFLPVGGAAPSTLELLSFVDILRELSGVGSPPLVVSQIV